MNMLRSILFYSLMFCAMLANAQTVPINRIADWTLAGYQGTIPTPSQIVDVTSFGAVGDGVTNDHAAIIAAKNSLTGIGVLYFPPGNYLVNNEINLPGSIILRGAGADSSTISFDLGNGTQNCINIVAAPTGDFYKARGGFQKGSSKIVVDSIQHFTAGSHCEILQENGSWDTNPAVWAEQSIGQFFKILSISGDTLVIDHPLRFEYDSLLNPRLRTYNPVEDVGIECIAIKRIDDPMGNSGYN
ncbi:MAG: hypothetical protein HKN22_01670, partial [Bacteroidia bacterium]|nr:hypothetical protein [Bacteroidia bacterium]